MTCARCRSAPLASVVRALALAAPLLGAGCSSGADADEATPPRFEASERFPGGHTTNTLLLGSNAFTRPATNVSDERAALFYSGNASFNQNWVQAPASTQQRDGLGPLFNARSCSSCHFKDGRGRPPLEEGEGFVGLLLRLSVPGTGEHGEPLPEPNYGGQLQHLAIPNVSAEGTPHVHYETVRGSYADGEPYELIVPIYSITELAHGPMQADAAVSPRVAPAMAGLGLLQAISLERLRELEDPDDSNGDGISGRINWVWDVVQQASNVGRFGWKAEQPSVRQQTAAALNGDLGITSNLFSGTDCTASEGDCAAAPNGGEPEISDEALDRLDVYGQLLAVPVRERWNDDATARGKALFAASGCASCHVPSHVTEASAALPELAEQTIWPYTDLLLHDLGEGLSDNRPSFAAAGNEWRTPPLWGLRLYPVVNGHDRLLHDGRARGVAEAILWHGGEAETARQAFVELSHDQRRLLVEFVESL